MAAQAIQLHVERPPFRVGNCCLVSIAKIRERQSRPVRRRATELAAGKGRELSEARRAELRSPRRKRVAQGTPQGRQTGLAFSLVTLLLAKQKKVTRASGAEHSGH